MAYNALSQTDQLEVASNSGSDVSDRSPVLESQSFAPLSLDFENFGGTKHMDTARVAAADKPSSVSLQSAAAIIRSRGASTATSYELLEEDEYKMVAEPGPNGDGDAQVGHRDLRQHQQHHKQRDSTSTPTTDFGSPGGYRSSAYDASRDAAMGTPEPVMQTPRSQRNSTPLRHPTPDLQSIQGAYVGNVERLEKSAERISMELDNNGIGLQDATMGQLKRISSLGAASSRSRAASAASMSNSIGKIASPSSTPGYGTLSRQSSTNRPRLRSGSSSSRLAHIIEPENESADASQEQRPVTSSTIPPPPDHHSQIQNQNHLHLHDADAAISANPNAPQPNGQHTAEYTTFEPEIAHHDPDQERPASAASGDSYQQSTNLFRDFDGVHFTPHIREVPRSRGVSLSKPPLAAQAEHYTAPPPGQDMVFYPAPVPMMLNLPQRLSRNPPANAEQEKRRTQLLSSISPDARKSAIWLADSEQGASLAGDRQSKRVSNLPPQLRASAFFDTPKAPLEVRIQGDSAVATLDSILDAAAHAPVSAFTDHPIVGHIGGDVYKQKRAKNKINKKRTSLKPGDANSERPLSSATKRASHIRAGSEGQTLDHVDETTSLRSTFDDHAGHEYENGAPSPIGEVEENSDEEEEDDEEEEEGGGDGSDGEPIFGQPTTLLAELQMRKHEQKMRTRTAATAFPNGMHSTLLELDSVAQRQRDKRDKGRVLLAWEGNQSAGQDEVDDEDVPLGVLFPEKSKLADENRPLGLMEKLLLEESEPLSRRRARIRGEPLNNGRATPRNLAPRDASPDKRASAAYTLDIPGLLGNDESGDEEEETLAQRKSRLRAREEGTGNNFSDDLISRFGDLEADSGKPKDAPQPAAEEPEEETLGQRRRRLQAEAQAQAQTNPGNPANPAAVDASRFQARRTMANILQAHPARSGVVTAHSELDPRYQAAMASNQSLQMPGSRASMLAATPLSMPGQRLSGAPFLPYANGPPPGTAPALLNGGGLLNNNGFGYPTTGFVYNPAMYPQPEMIDPNQRDMIDRWRLSVRQ
ncbi:uncharacterized protein GIQ15_04165 [Arthroderma uncinatum]|uniref:uncharacterized protein n=1 Tax=Arthroderma uncinatum TaxID=74035 RepID=UPI00144AAFA1|nr:uncharacterized protein GIQ15_04165 [Arthroderma uncinatum]KAF3481406.1 hypothetical protein GIQ15_04165 [Arthroderma uncinatum]